MVEEDDDDSSLSIKVKLFLNRYYQPTAIVETTPELTDEERERFKVSSPSLHFEHDGVLYRIRGDFIGPNGGRGTYYRHLMYKPERDLKIEDIVIS